MVRSLFWRTRSLVCWPDQLDQEDYMFYEEKITGAAAAATTTRIAAVTTMKRMAARAAVTADMTMTMAAVSSR
jgi:hypothetical protein